MKFATLAVLVSLGFLIHLPALAGPLSSQEEQERRDFNAWLQAPPDDPKPLQNTPSETERSYLKKYRTQLAAATGSGNGGNPAAWAFTEAARDAFVWCRELNAPTESLLARVQIRDVTFSLCQDDLSHCAPTDAQLYKVEAPLNLILVNHERWNALPANQRPATAGAAMAQLLGLNFCIERRP